MKNGVAVVLLILVVLTGCVGQQTETDSTPITTEAPESTSATSSTSSDGGHQLECTQGNPPENTNPTALLPNPPEDWETVEEGHREVVVSLENAEDGARGGYRSPDGELYDVFVGRYDNRSEAHIDLNGSFRFVYGGRSVRTGNFIAHVGTGDDASQHEILLSMPCVDEGDIIKGDQNITVDPNTGEDYTLEIGNVTVETEEREYLNEYRISSLEIEISNTGDVPASRLSVKVEANDESESFPIDDIPVGETVVAKDDFLVNQVPLQQGQNQVNVSVVETYGDATVEHKSVNVTV